MNDIKIYSTDDGLTCKRYTQLNEENDTEYIVDIYDNNNNNKHIMKATYEIYGFYNTTCSFWHWGYSNIYIEKDLYKTTKQVKNYYKDIKLKKNAQMTKQMEKYMYYSKNPVFYIHEKNLDDLLLFLTEHTSPKSILINKTNKIYEIYMLKKILQEK